MQVLVFVNDAEAGMRARLFLEAFGVRAALLNAELPLNSRHHILQVGCCTAIKGRACSGLWVATQLLNAAVAQLAHHILQVGSCCWPCCCGL